MTDDTRWMDRALGLAARGAGRVAPNPMVGAVLVGPGGVVLGEGWHGACGGPHAEVWAVRDAHRRDLGEHLRAATLYVTLEPCSHHGRTPPCTDLVLREGIPRVVVAMRDPFPAVDGQGIARLRAAGVEVRVGVRAAEAFRLNEAFVRHVTTGRPLVTLKLAQTLDGRVAARSGDSRWVTGPPARRLVHRWRAEHGAVLVGAGTARADDPALTVRHVVLPEGVAQPLRVVLDRRGTLPPSLRLFTDAHAARTRAVVAEGTTPPYAAALADRGGAVWHVPAAEHLDLGAVLDRLGAEGVQAVLVEAGPGLATALLRQDLVDRLAVFVAPRVLGEGRPAVGDLGAERMSDAIALVEHVWERVGDDLLLRGFLRPVPPELAVG